MSSWAPVVDPGRCHAGRWQAREVGIQVVGEGERDARSAQVYVGGEDVGDVFCGPKGSPCVATSQMKESAACQADRMCRSASRFPSKSASGEAAEGRGYHPSDPDRLWRPHVSRSRAQTDGLTRFP